MDSKSSIPNALSNTNDLPSLNINNITSGVKKKNLIGNSLDPSFGYLNTISNSMHVQDEIRLSQKVTISLKNTIDPLDLIPGFDDKFSVKANNEQINSFMDIFKRGKYENKLRLNGLDEINKFNVSILNNTKWGSDTQNKEKFESKRRQILKPTLKELEKEVGNNIILLYYNSVYLQTIFQSYF